MMIWIFSTSIIHYYENIVFHIIFLNKQILYKTGEVLIKWEFFKGANGLLTEYYYRLRQVWSGTIFILPIFAPISKTTYFTCHNIDISFQRTCFFRISPCKLSQIRDLSRNLFHKTADWNVSASQSLPKCSITTIIYVDYRRCYPLQEVVNILACSTYFW